MTSFLLKAVDPGWPAGSKPSGVVFGGDELEPVLIFVLGVQWR